MSHTFSTLFLVSYHGSKPKQLTCIYGQIRARSMWVLVSFNKWIILKNVNRRRPCVCFPCNCCICDAHSSNCRSEKKHTQSQSDNFTVSRTEVRIQLSNFQTSKTRSAIANTSGYQRAFEIELYNFTLGNFAKSRLCDSVLHKCVSAMGTIIICIRRFFR